MIERATGIILRTRPLTETSLIVNWLTAELGRISTVAKGARRSKSPFRGKLDLFYEADFSFQRSRRSELHALREAGLRELHAPLRTDLRYLRQASYCTELIEQTTERETPLPAIFQLLQQFLAALPRHPPGEQSLFAFELKMLAELGLAPDLTETNLSPGARQIAAKLAVTEFENLSTLKPSEAQTREVRQFLHGFLIYHLGKVPHRRSAALC